MYLRKKLINWNESIYYKNFSQKNLFGTIASHEIDFLEKCGTLYDLLENLLKK